MEVFEIDKLSFKYDEGEKQALTQVTLKVEQGDFILLCGKSGCGKSSLLRLLKPGLFPKGSRQGSINFFGKPIENVDEREGAERIGFVMQNPDNQLIGDDVYGELCFCMSQLGFDKGDMGRRVFETANYFGINHYLDMDIEKLSGGQKQLLTVAAALCAGSDVLLLDEPTASLDPNSAHMLISALEKINKELGITIIMAEQNLDMVYSSCNKIAAMEQGKMAFVCNKPMAAASIKGYGDRNAFPLYVRAYMELGGGGDCPASMNEAKKWISRFKGKDKEPEEKSTVMENGEKVLQGKNLWLRFDKNGRDVLKGVNLSLCRGEIACVLGANGSGKSTLLKTIAGVRKCYEGRVKVVGKIGMVCQSPLDIFTGSTVGEEFSQRDERLFNLFEINGLMNMHPYDLSGGEIQRVAAVIALMQRTDILLLDEITKGMGKEFKSRLGNELIKQSKERGLAVLLSSHDIDFCADYTDTCYLLFNGAVAAKGETRRVIRQNNYYTTNARILAKDVWENAVTERDVMEQCIKLKSDLSVFFTQNEKKECDEGTEF